MLLFIRSKGFLGLHSLERNLDEKNFRSIALKKQSLLNRLRRDYIADQFRFMECCTISSKLGMNHFSFLFLQLYVKHLHLEKMLVELVNA